MGGFYTRSSHDHLSDWWELTGLIRCLPTNPNLTSGARSPRAPATRQHRDGETRPQQQLLLSLS